MDKNWKSNTRNVFELWTAEIWPFKTLDNPTKANTNAWRKMSLACENQKSLHSTSTVSYENKLMPFRLLKKQQGNGMLDGTRGCLARFHSNAKCFNSFCGTIIIMKLDIFALHFFNFQ